MKEIKFRGKRKYTYKDTKSEWVYGYYMVIEGHHHIIPNCKDNFEAMNKSAEVIPKTVGQYTGRLDKNGKEIYNGDALKSKMCKGYGIVEWDNEYAGFTPFVWVDDEAYSGEFETEQIEIIGNIYENPELMKK